MHFLQTSTHFFSWHMIAAIKKKFIISRGSVQLELEFFVFFAFSLCTVSYLWIKSVISGLGFKIRNSLMSVGHASLEGCTWHCCWSGCCWMLFHSIFFDCFFTTSGSQVRHLYICDFHKNFIQSVRNKRKRKTSDDGGDSPEHDTDVPEVRGLLYPFLARWSFTWMFSSIRKYLYFKLQGHWSCCGVTFTFQEEFFLMCGVLIFFIPLWVLCPCKVFYKKRCDKVTSCTYS